MYHNTYICKICKIYCLHKNSKNSIFLQNDKREAPIFQSPRPMCQQKAAATPTTPVPSIPGTPTGLALLLQQLQFGTPSSMPSESLTSSNSSQLMPQLEGIKLGRGHGCPYKTPQPPMYDDFSIGAFQSDIDKYLKAKKTQRWQYKKLTSSSGSEHRQKECERVSKFYHEKKNLQKE